MGRIPLLVGKDLKRRLADPAGFLIGLAIPLVMVGMTWLSFGRRSGGEAQAPVMKVAVVDLDETPLSGIVASASQNPEGAKYIQLHRATSREEGIRLMREEELAAVVVIPKGFGEAVLKGEKARFEVVKNPAQALMPQAVEKAAEVLALYASAGSLLIGDERETIERLFDGEGWNDAVGLAALAAKMYARVDAAGKLLFPPIIEVGSEEDVDSDAGGFDFMGVMYPGIAVMGLLFVGIHQMRDLLAERDAGTLKRLLAAPLAAGHVLLAKAAGAAAVIGVALAGLLAIGWAGFGMRWGAPAPLAAASILIVLAVTGFCALVFAVVRTERQGDAVGGTATMLMSMLSGAMIPPQVMPEWLRSLSVFTLPYWCHEPLRALASGGGWAGAAPYLGPLAAMGVGLPVLGVGLLRWRQARGRL